MRLSVKALAIVGAVLFGGTFLLVGIGSVMISGYGGALLAVAESIYPGYHGPDGLLSALVVGAYATLDGAIGGALVAIIYNAVVHHGIPKGERFSA